MSSKENQSYGCLEPAVTQSKKIESKVEPRSVAATQAINAKGDGEQSSLRGGKTTSEQTQAKASSNGQNETACGVAVTGTVTDTVKYAKEKGKNELSIHKRE